MDTTCPICHDFLYKPYLTHCGHSFCESCWMRFSALAGSKRKNCPMCRDPLHRPAVLNRFAWQLLQVHYPKEVLANEVRPAERKGDMLRALMDMFRDELSSDYRAWADRQLACTVPSDLVHCSCGLLASHRVSRTNRNPGRLFYGCPRYHGQGTGCGFFEWGVTC